MDVLTITKENFEKEILEASVPALVDFWAEWCVPCRMLAPVIEEIALENGNIKVGKINVDEQPELAERYGVMSIPTVIVFKNGEADSVSVGVKPKEEILALMQK